MKNKFLTKNTKITLKEESKKKKSNYLTPPPPGLTTAEKVHDEAGKINRKALSDFAAKLKDYYDPDESDEYTLEEEDIPKVDGDDEIGSDDIDIFSIEALGSGKMSSLEYEAEGSKVEKKFQKRVDDLNDTSEYDKYFGTKDGFGETDEPDDTYKKMRKASAEYNKYEDEYELPPPLRVKQAKVIKTESKNNKKKTMKRLNFKNEFNTEYEMLQLIPENYKKDGHTFLMTDNNKTYKVRWDESLKEGSVLNYKNKKMINKNTSKMKKLYNYKYSDSQGKTNDYLTEGEAMRKMMDRVRGEDLIGEQQTAKPATTLNDPKTGKPFEVVGKKQPQATAQQSTDQAAPKDEWKNQGLKLVSTYSMNNACVNAGFANNVKIKIYKGTRINQKTDEIVHYVALKPENPKSKYPMKGFVYFSPEGKLMGQSAVEQKKFAGVVGWEGSFRGKENCMNPLVQQINNVKAGTVHLRGSWFG